MLLFLLFVLSTAVTSGTAEEEEGFDLFRLALKVGNVEGKVDSNTAAVRGSMDNIKTLETGLDRNTDNIKTLETGLESNTAALVRQGKNMNKLKTRQLPKIKQDVDRLLEKKLTEMRQASKVQSELLNNTVNALNTKNKALQEAVTNATITRHALQNSITTLTTQNNQLAAENIELRMNVTKIVDTLKATTKKQLELEDAIKNSVQTQSTTKKELEEAIKNCVQTQATTKEELESESKDSVDELRTELAEVKKKTFQRVAITSASMSSVLRSYYVASNAYDGNKDSVAITTSETKPWFKAQLSVKYSAIRVTLDMNPWNSDEIITLYTTLGSEETLCATYTAAATARHTWVASCPNTGTGFKVDVRRSSGGITRLSLWEITVDIQKE